MDAQQTFNIMFSIGGALAGIIGSCALWWINTIWSMVKSQQEQITKLNVQMVQAYVPRQELDKTFSQIFDKLDKIGEKVSHIHNNQAHLTALQEALSKVRPE